MVDLFATLDRLNIGPLSDSDPAEVYTEQRAAPPMARGPRSEVSGSPGIVSPADALAGRTQRRGPSQPGVRLGDRVVIRYLDDNKTATASGMIRSTALCPSNRRSENSCLV
jgi:hypothetical protein